MAISKIGRKKLKIKRRTRRGKVGGNTFDPKTYEKINNYNSMVLSGKYPPNPESCLNWQNTLKLSTDLGTSICRPYEESARRLQDAATKLQAAYRGFDTRQDLGVGLTETQGVKYAANLGKEMRNKIRDEMDHRELDRLGSVSQQGDSPNMKDVETDEDDETDDEDQRPSAEDPNEIEHINQENALICEFHEQGKPWKQLLHSGREPGGELTSRPADWEPDFSMCKKWDGGKGRKSQKKRKNPKRKSQKKKRKNSKRKSCK